MSGLSFWVTVTNFLRQSGFLHYKARARTRMRNRFIPSLTILIVTTFLTASVFAQAKSAEQDETGFMSELAFGGTSNSLGQVYEAIRPSSAVLVTCRAGTAPARCTEPNFQTSQQTTGTAEIARDNGFSTWVDISPNPYVDAELGYTRSIHYDLNSVSFSLGFNVGRLVRRNAHQ